MFGVGPESVSTLILCGSSIALATLLVLAVRHYTQQITALPELRAIAAQAAASSDAAQRRSTEALDEVGRLRRLLERRGNYAKPRGASADEKPEERASATARAPAPASSGGFRPGAPATNDQAMILEGLFDASASAGARTRRPVAIDDGEEAAE